MICSRCGRTLVVDPGQSWHKCDLGQKPVILIHADGTEETREIDADAADACLSITVRRPTEPRVATADELLKTYPAEVLRDRYNPKFRHLFPAPEVRELQYMRTGERDGVPVFREPVRR